MGKKTVIGINNKISDSAIIHNNVCIGDNNFIILYLNKNYYKILGQNPQNFVIALLLIHDNNNVSLLNTYHQ